MPRRNDIESILIIGSGPGGYVAAVRAARGRFPDDVDLSGLEATLLREKGDTAAATEAGSGNACSRSARGGGGSSSSNDDTTAVVCASNSCATPANA